jgi:Rrf2 family protein
MDLTLSRRGDYVVRAAISLARAWNGNGGYRKIREISEEMRIPASYTPQLLGLLARADLAEARAGRRGGYRLTRAPTEISMVDVIEAAEGRLVSRHCPIRGGPCRWDEVCAVHPTWVKASAAIRSVLEQTSLAQIAAVDRLLEPGEAMPAHRGNRHVDHTLAVPRA